MAGITSAARLPDPEDFDYSVSHRAVPIPTAGYTTTRTDNPPQQQLDEGVAAAGRARRDNYYNSQRAQVNERAGSRRRGSLDRLLHHRTASHGNSSGATATDAPSPNDHDAPPVPALSRSSSTRVAQARAQATAATTAASSSPTKGRSDGFSLFPSTTSNPGNSSTAYTHGTSPTTSGNHDPPTATSAAAGAGGSRMLRKLSSGRHEQDRVAREAAVAAARQQQQQHQTPRHPPRLPSINDFHDEDNDGAPRPDSLAIFSNQYGSSSSSSTPPALSPAPTQTTANFSRPANTAMPSSSAYNTSSSPAYALRSGNAFAQQAASATSSSSPAAPAVVSGVYDEPHVGPYQPIDRSESMAHRGRYSYASSTAPAAHVNSPRRVRRRKDPTPFNILVVGAKNSGKTSFISFLRHSFALPADKQPYSANTAGDAKTNGFKSTSFTSHYLETEMDGERVGLTLWDSAGLQKHIIDLQLREMASFVESKFEETFVEEQKVNRSPGVKDTHIHCVLLVLDPVKLDNNVATSGTAQKGNAEGLNDEMDLQVIRALWGKTTVIPVVSKADTLTVGHMSFLKRAVWSSLKTAKLDPLEALELDDEEDEIDEDDTLAEADEAEASHRDGVVNNLEPDSHDDDDDDEDDEDDEEDDLPKPKRNGHNRQTSSIATITGTPGTDDTPYIPMSILSPDPYDLPPYTKPSSLLKPNHTPKSTPVILGRRFPWGLADPCNPEHCDFVRLRDSIFSEWRGDLRDLARTKWYENWRTSRLKNLPGTGRQRVRGGITPTGVVPREGRMMGTREGREGSGVGGAVTAASVPRSVSAAGMSGGAEPRSTSKAERLMGISAADAQGSRGAGGNAGGGVGGGTYRTVDSYQ
ncbi:hypothetical protein LTR35_016909 [Friedmanniomyces endolithicus]|uniref:Septin-type G domain-containing protein n=1 Tax=Friedmanniomyces endolithicus TaxID=329885 RepID=A0AAN6FFQ9_9PEZI|nr:hypothetical protein LTR35_016909 [Friedmanniomyces endolithicus]KAK0272416.1 hypothetical protein LTS00_016255 [Friedmanniomyces endolithicus]KAK0314044.1 hypothetical protein LTR82_013354 [Friedmanniomyces endolithicus]